MTVFTWNTLCRGEHVSGALAHIDKVPLPLQHFDSRGAIEVEYPVSTAKWIRRKPQRPQQCTGGRRGGVLTPGHQTGDTATRWKARFGRITDPGQCHTYDGLDSGAAPELPRVPSKGITRSASGNEYPAVRALRREKVETLTPLAGGWGRLRGGPYLMR